MGDRKTCAVDRRESREERGGREEQREKEEGRKGGELVSDRKPR